MGCLLSQAHKPYVYRSHSADKPISHACSADSVATASSGVVHTKIDLAKTRAANDAVRQHRGVYCIHT